MSHPNDTNETDIRNAREAAEGIAYMDQRDIVSKLDPFTRAYIESALWSADDESDPSGGKPLDANYSIDDIAPETLAKIVADCKRFQEENAEVLSNAECSRGSVEEQAGHDFWLTRNGHGAGFWDGDWDDENDSGEKLDAACEAYGSVDLYVGDDGKVYA